MAVEGHVTAGHAAVLVPAGLEDVESNVVGRRSRRNGERQAVPRVDGERIDQIRAGPRLRSLALDRAGRRYQVLVIGVPARVSRVHEGSRARERKTSDGSRRRRTAFAPGRRRLDRHRSGRRTPRRGKRRGCRERLAFAVRMRQPLVRHGQHAHREDEQGGESRERFHRQTYLSGSAIADTRTRFV